MGVKVSSKPSSLKTAFFVSEEETGFRLAKPEVEEFTNADAFAAALKAQKDATATIDALTIEGVDMDGRVQVKGQNQITYTLSNAAFGDLCHWLKIPVGQIKHFATFDEARAMAQLESYLHTWWNNGQKKSLVIDTRTNRVDGIVGMGTYSGIANHDIFMSALAATSGIAMQRAYLQGPNMRAAFVLKDKPVEVVKGDVVNFGMNLESAVNGDSAVKISDFVWRLKCLNGLQAKDDLRQATVLHRGEAPLEKVQKAIVNSSNRVESLLPLLQRSTQRVLELKQVRELKAYLSEASNGGGESFFRKVAIEAQNEAKDEGRVAEELTLWNFVNGCTAAAKDTKSIARRNELELLGYKTLVRFGVQMKS